MTSLRQSTGAPTLKSHPTARWEIYTIKPHFTAGYSLTFLLPSPKHGQWFTGNLSSNLISFPTTTYLTVPAYLYLTPCPGGSQWLDLAWTCICEGIQCRVPPKTPPLLYPPSFFSCNCVFFLVLWVFLFLLLLWLLLLHPWLLLLLLWFLQQPLILHPLPLLLLWPLLLVNPSPPPAVIPPDFPVNVSFGLGEEILDEYIGYSWIN